MRLIYVLMWLSLQVGWERCLYLFFESFDLRWSAGLCAMPVFSPNHIIR